MNLLESQRVIAAALMQPWNPRGRAALAAAGLIKPNSRLSAAERLEIYSRSYWCRLMDSLREDFPGLEAILGHAAFERAAAAYLADCPSTSFTLRDLGSRLESWLRAHRRYAGRNPALATDMARLEWAHIVAFDGLAEPILQPGDVAAPAPGFRLGVQPYLSLLDLGYPVDRMRVAVNAGKRPARTAAETVFLAVHRLDHTVYYRRLRAEEFRLLGALRAGKPIGAAIRLAFRESTVHAEERPELLQAWFAAWTGLGWLTARPAAAKGTNS